MKLRMAASNRPANNLRRPTNRIGLSKRITRNSFRHVEYDRITYAIISQSGGLKLA